MRSPKTTSQAAAGALRLKEAFCCRAVCRGVECSERRSGMKLMGIAGLPRHHMDGAEARTLQKSEVNGSI